MHIRYALPFTIVPSLGLVLFSLIISANVKKKKGPSLFQLDVGCFSSVLYVKRESFLQVITTEKIML